MDLIPIPATKPDSPAVSSDAVEAEPGFGNLIESLLSGITGAIGGQSGTDGEDVDPDDRGDPDGTAHPFPGLAVTGAVTETPATGPPSLPAPFRGWDSPSLEIQGDLTRSVSRPGVLATPASPPTRPGAGQTKGGAATPPGSTPSSDPPVPAPAARTDEAPKPVPTVTPDETPTPAPVSVGAPGIPDSVPAAPAGIASPAPEATGPSRMVGHRPSTQGSTPPPLSADPDPDPTATDVTIAQRETGTPEADPETQPGRIEPDMGSPTSESPEGQIARATTPPQGTDRPGMAELVDRIREWADRVENAQRTDTISLKLADPDGELLVRLAMRDGRLEVNVSRPGGDTPSWLLDQLDDALARRGFDMAGGGGRRGPEDGEAGDTLAEGEQPRQRTTKRDQDGLWM